MKTLDFNHSLYAHRYWSEVIRQDPQSDDLAGNQRQLQELLEDAAVDAFLTNQGWRRDAFEPRGGSRRRPWRPWRDWLHLHRAGTNAQEAKRWNADLKVFRRAADLPRTTLDLDREFGPEVSVQRAFVEFVQGGAADEDVTAREIKERRRRWRRKGSEAD